MCEQNRPPEVHDGDKNDEAMSRDEEDSTNRTSAEPLTNTYDEINNIESSRNDDCPKRSTDNHVKEENEKQLNEKDNRPVINEDLEQAHHSFKTDMKLPDEIHTVLDTSAGVRFSYSRELKSFGPRSTADCILHSTENSWIMFRVATQRTA